ncbi:MAG: YqaJ viral recombinase family protein [Nitrosomonas sp.]|nr:YqaJ viral recombinase family protein [Nitrosomonas sp.]
MNAVIQEIPLDRKRYIGSSDAASILGVSPWKSIFQLYQEKTGEYQEEITPAKQKIFNRGKRWEPIVIEMLVDELEDRGHDVKIMGRNNRFLDPEYDFLASEIDLELIVDGEFVNGEMKTVHPFAAKDWGEEGTDEIPIYYTSQVLHGQMVTGRSKTIVAALIGADDLRVHFVNRDEEMIQFLRAKEIEFWDRLMNRQAPEPTTKEDIKRLYQYDSGLTIEATPEIVELCRRLKVLKTHIKKAETKQEVLATRVKAAMGEAALLIHEGQKLATWKTNKDSVKTDWEEAFHDLKDAFSYEPGCDEVVKNILAEHTTTKTGARPFSLK